MVKSLVSLSLLLFCISALGGDLIEVPVNNVLIPHDGFDDNDRIEMVVTGEFPHACFTLGDASIERRGNVLRVHQHAWLRDTGNCATGSVSDQPMPFTSEVTIGRLAAGNYEVEYLFFDSAHRTKLKAKQRFRVEKATATTIDEHTYAAVSGVNSQLLVFDGESVTAELSGLLSSACEDLGEVKVLRQKDVFVVLPLQSLKTEGACPRKPREFHRSIGLGKLEPGQYLIHVRSMNGKAVNRVVYVLPPS